MKVKAGVNFHNRFDVVKNGEWVGYAENIVLDQMYNRICNFSTYFVNIHFGTGSGTPTPERTTLFTHLGTKTAVNEELVKAFPTSKWVRRIVLNPEEYVGRVITEVGVAYSSTTSHLVTHAMIKDSEGNPLSINKTDLDVVEIYATIFIEIVNQDRFIFTDLPNNNQLVNYLCGGGVPTSLLRFGTDGKYTDLYPYSNINREDFSKTGTRTNVGRSVLLSTRLGITECNKPIQHISWDKICRLNLPKSPIYEGYLKQAVTVGVGDGINEIFILPDYDVKELVVKVDGVVTSNYVLNRNDYLQGCPLLNISNLATNVIDGEIANGSYSGYGKYSIAPDIFYYFNLDTTLINNHTLNVNCYGMFAYTAFYIDSSPDGVVWTRKASGQNTSSNYSTGTVSYMLEPNDAFIRVSSSHSSANVTSVNYIYITNTLPTNIEFNSPPSDASIITCDYFVDYAPKTSDFVLDAEIELQFGEGV